MASGARGWIAKLRHEGLLDFTRRLGYRPVPHLIALATGASEALQVNTPIFESTFEFVLRPANISMRFSG